MALIDLINDVRIISVIGLAKNTGKTIVVKKIINELSQKRVIFGITSMGYDGEKFDQLNHLIKKPRIKIPKGNLVATTDFLIKKSKAKINILFNTDFLTPLGKILLCELKNNSILEIAGPSTVQTTSTICKMLLEYGAKKIIIDGAIDRKAISSPLITDGCIIATGAVLNTDIDKVIKETKSSMMQYMLPSIDDMILKELIVNLDKDLLLIRNDYDYIEIRYNTLLNSVKLLQYNISENVKYIYLSKSITNNIVSDLAKYKKGNPLTIVVKDSTKVFLTGEQIIGSEKKGIFIKVLYPLNILAITVNPVAPLSHRFCSRKMISMLKDTFNTIPVVNVLSDSYN